MTARWITALLVGLALVATGCSGNGPDHGAGYDFSGANPVGRLTPTDQRQPAGDFTADRLDGSGTFTLSHTKGEVVVVNYWASTCAPCRTEMPAFDRVYRANRDKGVAFVGVDTKEAPSLGRRFVRAHHIGYPNVSDKIGKTALELGDIPAIALPFTVLIDRHGDVAGVYLGELTGTQLRSMLDALRAET